MAVHGHVSNEAERERAVREASEDSRSKKGGGGGRPSHGPNFSKWCNQNHARD